MTPILMLGAGRMGGALIEGWSLKGAFAPSDLIIRDPYPSREALAAADAGARLNPDDGVLAEAKVLLLAVKPQMWREAAAQIADLLAPDCIIVSIAAGVRAIRSRVRAGFACRGRGEGRHLLRPRPTRPA